MKEYIQSARDQLVLLMYEDEYDVEDICDVFHLSDVEVMKAIQEASDNQIPTWTKNVSTIKKRDTSKRHSVYFIQQGDFIKIGYTSCPVPTRLAMLQTGSVEKMELLLNIPGRPSEERELHNKFKHLRHRGEWFRAERELLEYIEGIKVK